MSDKGISFTKTQAKISTFIQERSAKQNKHEVMLEAAPLQTKHPKIQVNLTKHELDNIHEYVQQYMAFLQKSSGKPVGKFDPWHVVTE